jgi:hypothetical protein
VLPTIQLNYQSCFHADQIDNVTTDPMLPAKLAAELLIAQARPEPMLRIRRFNAHLLGVIHHFSLPLIPALSPQAG